MNSLNNRIKYQSGELQIGKSLPYTLYGVDGNICFKKGFIINTPKAIVRIQKMELFFDPEEGLGNASNEPVSSTHRKSSTEPYDNVDPELIFNKIDSLVALAGKLLSDIRSEELTSMRPLIQLIERIRLIYRKEPDMCLAAVHMHFDRPYSALHPVYSGFLAQMACEGLLLSEQQQRSIAAAAVTANLGMFNYHDELIRQNGPLTSSQREELERHPETSISMLKKMGITDRLWLDIIAHHHERGDGSGYPRGLTKEHILFESTVLGTIDTYLSLIMPRAYRQVVKSNEALRQIYQMAISDNNTVTIGFIKQIGLYPPGSFVILKNNEIAIVTHRNKESSICPILSAIGTTEGVVYETPVRRNAAESVFSIKSAYYSHSQPIINCSILW